MPKMSFVMPLYRSEQFLARAIESLLDQDVEDWSLVVVADGISKDGPAIVQQFKDKRIRYITIPHAGACAARNAGAKISDGEYLSFFSSDFQAVPGMLRTWLSEFEAQPDVDFIYGPYKFPENQGYNSEPFDPRQLETYNYIDGGFPLKRKLWEEHPWDENLKSLNDWDFWLRIVKAGYKGHFMDGYYSYIAELPRKGGLSHDSGDHWLERLDYIKKKNNIPQRKICVSSLGSPFFGKQTADLLDADFITMPGFKPHKYEMIYLLGFYTASAGQHARVFMGTVKGKCKRVIHWLGSDIFGLGDMKHRDLRTLAEALNEDIDLMFCESEVQKRDLTAAGLNVEVLPLIRDFTKFKRKPLPKGFAVGIYMPQNNAANYHPVLMENIVKNMPDVQFYMYGDPRMGKDQSHKNIQFMGWCDINELIDKCSVLLRYTHHDGLPTAPMEFMVSGRFVLTNAEMPHVEKLENTLDEEGVRKHIIEKIRDLKRRIKGGEQPSPKAERYYRKYVDKYKIKKKLYAALNHTNV